MLENQTTGFIDYCKLTDFSTKSIESLSASLREFSVFVQSLKIKTLPEITYSHLLDFVADFRDPSIHKKKARVWCLHRPVLPDQCYKLFTYLRMSRTSPNKSQQQT